MESILKFNKLLNKSDNNRSDFWSEYRADITSFICQNIPSMSDKICILGAGNSDDIDLIKIASICSNLYLTDIDKISISKSIQKYNLNTEKTQIFPFDYIGLNSCDLWNNFVKEIIKIENKNNIDILFNHLKEVTTKNRFNLNLKFDVLIISPIYTQLLFQQGLNYINVLNNLNYPLKLISYIKDKLLWLTPYVIDTFNFNVKALLKDTSSLVVLSDIFEAKKDSAFYTEAKNLKNIEALYRKYSETYGMGLGDYGLYNVSLNLRLTNKKWFEWPFNKNKSLFVKALILKK